MLSVENLYDGLEVQQLKVCKTKILNSSYLLDFTVCNKYIVEK